MTNTFLRTKYLVQLLDAQIIVKSASTPDIYICTRRLSDLGSIVNNDKSKI